MVSKCATDRSEQVQMAVPIAMRAILRASEDCSELVRRPWGEGGGGVLRYGFDLTHFE